jgi:hypothetical protein
MAAGEPFDRDSAPRPVHALRRVEIRPHMLEGLALLRQAHEYAQELGQDPWELAVELEVLRAAKLSNSDLRWLVGVGYVEHAVEISGPSDHTRQFRRTPLLNFDDATCLILTPAGVVAAQEACERESITAPSKVPAVGLSVEPAVRMPQVPTWDDQRRQLRIGSKIVKEFKLPSPNQETVLMAFEEEGWPPRIDDPLSPQAQLDPRRRLHDTIKALNRKQKHPALRFMGDGSGEGIRWELRTPKPGSTVRSAQSVDAD